MQRAGIATVRCGDDLARCFDGSMSFGPTRMARRRPSIVIVAIALVGVVLVAAACGGGLDGGSPSDSALIDALPDNGDLGAGWARVTEARVGDPAESLDLCGVQLNEGMIEGAKVDLANDREDFASTFFRRYADADAARRAFREASERITQCPETDIGGGRSTGVTTVTTPNAGDAAYGALFTVPPTDASLLEQFGWTLVQTGDVVRSLTYSPAEPRPSTADELIGLAEAVAATR